MPPHEELVEQLRLALNGLARVDGQLRSLVELRHSKQWEIGRIAFEIFHASVTDQSGGTIGQLAETLGAKLTAISVPLRVYRYLGAWYQEQIEIVPFTIANATVRHDPEDALRLMNVWIKRGRENEKAWKKFLDGPFASEGKPIDTDSEIDDDERRRESQRRLRRARAKFDAAAKSKDDEIHWNLLPDRELDLTLQSVRFAASLRRSAWNERNRRREAAVQASIAAPAATPLAVCVEC